MRNVYTSVVGLVILCISFVSCGDEYFEDETNLLITIPQISENTIDNLHIFLHHTDPTNNSAELAEHYVSPFDDDMRIKDGKLRLAVYPTSYSVICLANTENLDTKLKVEVVNNNKLDESYVTLEKKADGIYNSSPKMRMLTHDKIVEAKYIRDLPMNSYSIPVEASSNVTGRIKCVFTDLPSQVKRIDVYVKNLGSKIFFKKNAENTEYVYGYASENDYVLSTYNIDKSTTSSQSFESDYFPSYDETKGLELKVEFFDNSNIKMASILEDFSDNLPDDYAKETVILKKQETLTVEFDGFLVGNITLIGWGDIDNGGITPM